METCEIAGYFATLTKEEVIEFMHFFFELGIDTGTEVNIKPIIGGSFKVNLLSEGAMDAPLLVASFTDGMMAHRGWDKKFQRITTFV